MATRTESFNELNVANDFKEIIDQAQVARTVLNNGSQDIDAVIGNASMADAYSGQAAKSIKNQWADLASTFENFLQNFQNWYDKHSEAAKANNNLQATTATVHGTEV